MKPKQSISRSPLRNDDDDPVLVLLLWRIDIIDIDINDDSNKRDDSRNIGIDY